MASNVNHGIAYENPLDRLADCFGESLYNLVTRRIRLANTLFDKNVKLSFRQMDEEHWALLPRPYLLVVPTMSRGLTTTAPETLDDIDVARMVSMIAQFDGRASEHEWMAVNDIEAAEKELLGCLLGWRPADHFKPTLYGGMRVMGTRLPDVKVTFSFIFTEPIDVAESVGIPPWTCMEEPNFIVKPKVGCCEPCDEPPEECEGLA